MSHLLRHHRAVVDPFGRGHTATQLGYMMNGSRGKSWPWINGGVVLLRRPLYPTPGQWQPVGIAQGEDTQIKNFPGMTHSADQAYAYTAAGFLGNGMISAVHEPIRLDFDSGGALISPRMPTWPIHLVAKQAPGGAFDVVWRYSDYGQGAAPTDFQVFEGATPATVDYATSLGTVTATAKSIYTFRTGAYADRSSHVFGVRSRNSGGVAEKNTFTTTSVRARVVTPADVGAPSSAVVDDYPRTGVRL